MDNKNFLQKSKPCFSVKGNFPNKVMISETDWTFSNDRRLSESFHKYSMNITEILDLKPSIISTTTSFPKVIES